MKQHYFISGFPRAGSTVLAALLKQNPKFYAGMTSNLFNLCALIAKNSDIETGVQKLTYEQSRNVITKVIEGYHLDKKEEVIFDTNRGWVNFAGALRNLLPNTKIICCVRDLPSIINSYETHYQNKCITVPSYHSPNKNVVDIAYNRINTLFDTQIIPTYDNCKYYYESGAFNDMLIFVDYDVLISHPVECMKDLYERLGQEYFEHDFDNVEASFDDVDSVYQNHELHKVTGKLEKKNTKWVVPYNVKEIYDRPCFWRN